MHYFITALTLLCLCCSCSNPPSQKSNSDQHAHIAVADDPTSLDPRFVRDLPSSTTMRLLFEGLMKTTQGGKVIPGIAETVSLSEDKKTYTFYLRPTSWADGTPLTAEDFVQTWKSVLSPSTPAPNAYQLYLIKGAKNAKEGIASIDSIGVKAQDPHTLVVELEYPAPYFLEMVSCHFFFPVHPLTRTLGDKIEQEKIIGNGPFKLDTWTKRSELKVGKNPYYWDASHVALDGLSLQVLDENTALQLFQAGELDWAGSPLSTLPQDSIISLKQRNILHVLPGAGTFWFRLNTNKLPFTNEKMRRAFALAINRKSLVEHITQGNQLPAIGIIPPAFGIPSSNDYTDNDTETAKILFSEALQEENLSPNTFPSLTLNYAYNDRYHKIAQAIQQQWNQTFGINIALGSNESQVHLDKIKKGDYWISLGSWFADIRDPINFLEIFKLKDTPTNQTFWQSLAFVDLLDRANLEADPEKRLALLAAAEKVLIKAMPVIPLFHSAYNYLKNEKLEGVYFSPLGYLDFKEAYFDKR